MPRRSGVPPCSSTAAARVAALLSNTWPGAMGPPGATTSFPVDRIATTGRRQTGTCARPMAASIATSRDVTARPRRSTVSPIAMSDPAPAMNAPGAAGAVHGDAQRRAGQGVGVFHHHHRVGAAREHAAGGDDAGLVGADPGEWGRRRG